MGRGQANRQYTPMNSSGTNSHVVGGGGDIIYKIGIYGWRKRCLYLLILILLIMIIINMALTIWILKVMDFSIDGMGKLRITPQGLRLEGKSEFLKPLYASEILSREDEALVIQSSQNITLNARDMEDTVTSRLVVGDKNIVAHGEKFEVKNSDGETLFSANTEKIVLGSDTLQITGSGGVEFESSIQTPHVRADAELRLESPTQSLYIRAPKGVEIEAPVGGITASCLSDFRITSDTIHLDSPRIKLSQNLKVSTSSTGTSLDAYHLCACPNGVLFLSENCQNPADICLT